MTMASESVLPAAMSRMLPRAAAAAALVALGDWLFYGRDPGISVLVFLLALAAAALACNPPRLRGWRLGAAGAFLLLSLLPLVEALGLLPILSGITGTAFFLVAAVGGAPFRGWRLVSAAEGLLVCGPFQILPDTIRLFREGGQNGRFRIGAGMIIGWLVPLGLSLVFLALFAAANPLIEGWLSRADRFELVGPDRIVLWAILLAFVWGFVALKLRGFRVEPGFIQVPMASGTHPVLGEAAILRSLVLFNIVFGIETVLDILYLWGGLALPDGMTYATYAHRGAYPLIVTALLAAAFVLVAMRPGGPGENSPAIRGLVFLWIGQNVLLVLSSILRLDLYVEVYSLTLLRSAAFIWMLLVAAGLVLIVIRIALRLGNRWLVGANLVTLAATLYVCSFVNFSGLVADYNLAHSREAGGKGGAFDLAYALQLGPRALPAIDRYLVLKPLPPGSPLVAARDRLALEHSTRLADWRAWSYRRHRLQRYLDARANAKPEAEQSAVEAGRS